jgi:outer membrane murein-binding lipoprotein Lpp
MSMRARPARSRARFGGWTRVLPICAASIAVVALAGCGSSAPAYCTARTNLENSVKGLSSAGIGALKSQMSKIQSDANALVESAKSDFPNETNAISSSVNTLKNSLAALPSNPSATQIATVTKDAANVTSSVKSFYNSTSSQCG